VFRCSFVSGKYRLEDIYTKKVLASYYTPFKVNRKKYNMLYIISELVKSALFKTFRLTIRELNCCKLGEK